MNFDTFLNSIVFGQGKGKFFTTSKESDRRGILEDILGLGIFDEYQKEAKKRKSEASGKIEVADENIRGLNNRIIKLEELKEQSNSSELETLKKELQDKSISDTR